MINNKLNIKKKVTNFWFLQITGWLIYTVITVYYRYAQSLPIEKYFSWILGVYPSALGIALILKIIYDRLDYKTYSITSLAGIVTLLCIFTGTVWYWGSRIITFTIQGEGRLNLFIERLTIYNQIFNIGLNSLTLILWSGFYITFKLQKEYELQLKRTEQAKNLALAAQLKMLRYQLNPHFLFNSLNSIKALISEDKQKAKEMITELSEFLRYSLISKNYSEVPLSAEIEAIRSYFSIEQKRFEDKLEVNFNISPLAEDYPILSFLLHPLAENAVKYGMQTTKLPLKIQIVAEVLDERLYLKICNSGNWLSESKPKANGTGTGLSNVKKRLEKAYPGQHKFEIIKSNQEVIILVEINRKKKYEKIF